MSFDPFTYDLTFHPRYYQTAYGFMGLLPNGYWMAFATVKEYYEYLKEENHE